MNIAIAILGLALLVLVHELGHFSTARLVGMNPRRFYIGFPPAVFKVTRKGTEYGIGAIPLGGYVKIPGMHRPAASDLDLSFSRALAEDTGLLAPLERVKRELVVFDLEQARAALPELERATAEARLSPQAAKAAERGLSELRDGLADDAYWRASTWKRIVVILAGPAANIVFAVVVFSFLFMFGGGKATTTVHDVLPGKPAVDGGAEAGRPDHRDRRPAREGVGDPEPDQQLERPPARADRAARRGHAPDRARCGPRRSRAPTGSASS